MIHPRYIAEGAFDLHALRCGAVVNVRAGRRFFIHPGEGRTYWCGAWRVASNPSKDLRDFHGWRAL